MNPKILADLRKVLATLYPEEFSIRRIVADSGINSPNIAFNATATNTWYSVLTEAEKLDRVEALLDVVEGEYGSNREFLTACAPYRQLSGKAGSSNLASYTLKNEQGIQVKPQSQRLPTLFLGLLLLSSVAGGGLYWNFFNLSALGDNAFTATTTKSAPHTREAQTAVATITPVATPTSLAAATKLSPTETSTSTNMPTSTPTTTPQPTATALVVYDSDELLDLVNLETPEDEQTCIFQNINFRWSIKSADHPMIKEILNPDSPLYFELIVIDRDRKLGMAKPIKIQPFKTQREKVPIDLLKSDKFRLQDGWSYQWTVRVVWIIDTEFAGKEFLSASRSFKFQSISDSGGIECR